MKTKQSITGNNNLQIGVNNGYIIRTDKVQRKIEVVHNPDQHITDAQAMKIRGKITELVEMITSDPKKSKPAVFKEEYNALYKHFGITSYKLLPKDKYEEAITWLQKRIAYKGKKRLRRGDTEVWRKKQYSAIYTRAREMGMTREEVLHQATILLALKSPLESLKDVSDTRLQKIYNYIFSK